MMPKRLKRLAKKDKAAKDVLAESDRLWDLATAQGLDRSHREVDRSLRLYNLYCKMIGLDRT